MNWNFQTFFFKMLPITLSLLFVGIVTCIILEKIKLFDYGSQIPESVRTEIQNSYRPFRTLCNPPHF